MAFMLDPNFAYLLIVAGFLLLVFALLTPGTGLFEAGAVVVLALAAWRIVELSVNVWALVLLGLGIVPFILAIRNMRRNLSLGLTIAAFVIGSAFLFRSETWWQPAVHPVLALVTSFAAGSLFWLMTTKILEAKDKRPSHDLTGLVGSLGEARTDIRAEGSVYLHGEMWTAESEHPISAGRRVKVVSREGFVLHVKEIEEIEELGK